ncbi:MAG: type II toxin-antitoxin system VapC family toxin [Phycicoccus sp.]
MRRFWDASAVVPLLVTEPTSEALVRRATDGSGFYAWWATPVECTSAMARREREGVLAPADVRDADDRLQALAAAWVEVQPTSAVRTLSMRLLRTHPLRAADSLQLAAALVAADHAFGDFELVCLDARLGDAAQREGLRLATTDG